MTFEFKMHHHLKKYDQKSLFGIFINVKNICSHIYFLVLNTFLVLFFYVIILLYFLNYIIIFIIY